MNELDKFKELVDRATDIIEELQDTDFEIKAEEILSQHMYNFDGGADEDLIASLVNGPSDRCYMHNIDGIWYIATIKDIETAINEMTPFLAR